MYLDAAKLEDEVANHLHRQGYDLVDFQIRRVAQGITYRVFLDRLDLLTVTLSDCEKASLPLKLFLVALGVFDDSSQLEISSPGLDRVLKRDKDFVRFRGNRIKVTFRDSGAKKTVVGLLADFDGNNLVMESVGNKCEERLSVPLQGLMEARLVCEV